jgi:WD40 repeat protein
MSHCPTPAELDQFLEEQLDDERQETLSLHVASCPTCQAALERLTERSCVLPDGSLAVRLTPRPAPSAAFLDQLKQTPPDVPLSRPFSSRSAGSAPPQVPGYEILGELGRGGMGIVYKARQISLNRIVALKMVLAGSHAGPQDLARFRQEAEAVVQLRHPNVVQIYDVGEAGGRPYIALEYVEQGSLVHRLHGDPQPLEPAVALVETLARTIHYAHEKGIIHRDLKPANVLLGHDGIPKITDFGLAKRLDASGTGTRSGEVLGTPSYMAPEQANRHAAQVRAPADVYALGAILYEMLTGRPPFKGATPLDTVLQVLHDEPVPPRRLRPQVPRDLETICLKCLNKEPHRRYVTALALADDLRNYRRGAPIHARPVGPLERGWKWARRRPLSAGLAVGILLVAVLGFAGVTWQWQEARLARDVALEEKGLKEEQRRQAENARRQEAAQRRRATMSLYFSLVAQSQLQWRVNDLAGARHSLALCGPALDGGDARHGWEWHYLSGLYHNELLDLDDPPAVGEEVEGGVAFRPDGGAVASLVGASMPGEEGRTSWLRLWDVRGPEEKAAGVPPCSASRLATPFHRLAYHPDGTHLALAGGDGTVLIWDTACGQEVLRRRPHGQRITALAFNPTDGTRLATAGADGQVKLSDLSDKDNSSALPGVLGPVHGLAFHPHGRFLAAGGAEDIPGGPPRGIVTIWDTHKGTKVRTWPAHQLPVYCVAFSPDGRHIVSAGSNGNLKVWDWNHDPPQVRQNWAGQTGAILALGCSPDGRHVAYGGTDRTVRVWNVRSGVERVAFRGHTAAVEGVQFSPDGRLLVSCSPGQGRAEVKVWDLTRHPEYATLARATADVEAVAFQDGGRLLSVSRDGAVQTWDAASGVLEAERRLPLASPPEWPAVLASFGPDGRQLAGRTAGAGGNVVKLWDTADGAERMVFQGHSRPVCCVRLSSDGRRLATCAFDPAQTRGPHVVKIWNTETGEVLATWEGAGRLFTAAFSPDGRWLVLGGDRGLRVFDWLVVRPLELHGDGQTEVTAIAFSSNGHWLAAAGLAAGGKGGGVVHVWDWTAVQPDADGRHGPLHVLPAPALLCDLAFAPDGRRLAGISRDLVKVWDPETGQEVLTLRGAPQRHHDQPFNPRIAFSPDGTRLAGTNWDESISVWEAPAVDRDDEAALLRQRQERRLTAERRAPSWHLREAAFCIERKNRSAAEFHLRQLGSAPLSPPLLQRRNLLVEQLKGLKTTDD